MAGAKDFCHLHLHTEYSLLDGASRIAEVAKRAADWDMPAVALTDHGNMYGAVDFYNACNKQGVKPILGVEAYMLAEGSRHDRTRGRRDDGGKNLCHLTLLAENETGYRNLLKMVSDSWLNGFYYKPRMDHELLAAHSEGLICLSACLAGEVPQLILNGQRQQAVERALWYRDVLGPDNYFLELMEHHIAEDRIVNEALIEISRETGIPLVATNDVHYVEETDADPQDLLLCIQTGCMHADPNRMRMSTRELFFRSADQMWELFGEVPEALLRTREIAERCDVKLRLNGDLILPEFPLPPGHTAGSYLRELCLERLGRFYSPVTAEIAERLDYELKVIDDKGYSAYMLIVWDLIDYGKRNGMRIGPGRGSAAGSLVAYVLGITELDPIRYSLFFERFLNPERPSAPDIDIDFPPERRDEIVAYTIAKYGDTRTAKIITYGTMGAKAAIKDVGRVLARPVEWVNQLTALVPDRPGTKLATAIEEVDELRRRAETDESAWEVIEAALRLEGLTRHTSIHAAALVIARDELDNYVPLCRVSSGEDVVTQFDMGAIEQCGLLKMDFLGLRTMTVIDEACRLVRENDPDKPDFDVRQASLEDEKTYQLIGRGDVIGVFQLESGGFQRVCRDMKPDRIDDIVALVALYRPGPMDNIPEYIARKHGLKQVVYKHPLLEPILEPTYGIIVYQEQVMQIGRDLAGFSLGEADLIRKAVGKKDAASMAKVRKQFIAGCEANGIAESLASELMDEIEAFASYAFNKSHSACYAIIAYWTAYLKANHPAEFMAAQLTSVMDKREQVVKFIEDTRAMKINVTSPCVNTGGPKFETHGDHIVYGMAAINGVGIAVCEAIVAEREANGEYADLYDLCRRVDRRSLPKAALEKLIRAGACSTFGNRAQLLESYESIHEAATKAQIDEESGQGSLFDGFEDEATADVLAPQLKAVPEFPREQLVEMDSELLGLVVFEDPHAEMRERLAEVDLEFNASSDIALLCEGDKVMLAGRLEECRVFQTQKGDAMMAGRLQDGHGSVDFVIFPKAYAEYSHLAVQGEVVLVVGSVKPADEQRGRGPQVAVDRLCRPEQWASLKRQAKTIVRPKLPEEAPPASRPANGDAATRPGNGQANGHGTRPTELAATAVAAPPAAPEVEACRIVLRIGTDLGRRLDAVAEVLSRYPGAVRVQLWLEDGGERRRLSLGTRFGVAWGDDLRRELERIAGCAVREG